MNYKLFFVFVIFFFQACFFQAYCACEDVVFSPTILVDVGVGNTYYHTDQSATQFSPDKMNKTVRGLTISRLLPQFEVSVVARQQSDGYYCVVPDKITGFVGFKQFDVYIDKKYPRNSCNFKVVLAHEKKHIRIQTRGLDFYEGTIHEAITIATKKLKPVAIQSPLEVSQIANRMSDQFKKDIQPVLDFVSEKIREKNLALDTQEEYTKDTLKCKKW